MKKKINSKLKITQRVMFAVVAALVATVLVLAFLSRNTVTRSRAEGDYTAVENVRVIQYESDDRIISECHFTADNIDHAETLAFYVNHHEITVYLADECVYKLTAAEDSFKTVGGTWVMIPLYESDEGKEITVELKPLYKNYRIERPEFLKGSEIAVHNVTLHRALPALMLGLCVVFTGFLLICLAVYHTIKEVTIGRLYALGLLGISAGLWRISYDRVAFLLLPNHTVLVYTVSILSLMSVALSMLNALEVDRKDKRIIQLTSLGYCAVYIVQLGLQIAGIADLRQTLKAVHATIIISAAVFVISGVKQLIKAAKSQDGRGKHGWILGMGVVIDLVMYYMAATSFVMVFTLVAILCYSVLEGIHLLFKYIRQKSELEEMEVQLKLSRTTTMMSQIRSHFVFNILNAISGMCKYDPEMADETVVRFARYLRSNIDIMESDKMLPFTTDLQQLEDYVALEQVRFDDKIEFYTDIEVDDFKIPPLILQPVVENAIKHGVSKKQGNGSIILRTHEENGNIIITVEDDGVGFDMAQLPSEKSVGLRNISFRLKHLVNGTLKIKSEVDVGTTVTITIPREGQ